MNWRPLYSLLWYAATPFIRQYLRRRAKQASDYLEHWDERFGITLSPKATGCMWIHAVSVGETRAAMPLIKALRSLYPRKSLLITQMTPTGRATAIELYGEYAEIRYLPYDYPKVVKRFIEVYQPCFGVLMETELWPNLLHATKQAGVPLFLANARLSEKSFKNYCRISGLIRPAIQQLTATAAQSEADSQRLQYLGANPVVVCGNMKYDITPPIKMLELGKLLRQNIGKRPVLVCASTREGEEALILNAWSKIKSNCLLVLIPRHPERFTEVYRLVVGHSLSVQCRSDDQPIKSTTRVWLGDSMGELFAYYQLADVVFVGGSLREFGCHSLIEPASVGRPILFGPSTFNFTEASQMALAAGAASQVANANAMVYEALKLIQDDNIRRRMGNAAKDFTAVHQGATARVVKLMTTYLPNITR